VKLCVCLAFVSSITFGVQMAVAQDQIIDTHAHIMLPGQERAFNPKVEGTAKELRIQGFDVANPNVLAVAKKAGEKGLPVIFDSISAADGGMVGKFIDIAIANPETKFVLAHMGGNRFH